MFSPEFDQVYREAFISATGRDFVSDENDYVEYTEKTADALLERWNTPDFDPSPISGMEERRGSQAFWIKHPSTGEFTADDARDIAHVRYFGRAIITAAQTSLNQNEYIDHADRDSFRGSNWHRAHPETPDLEDLGYDSQSPSPQRLREWPRGDYMNCLGISIAVAADSANADIEYRYMNRIRDARHESARDAAQFLEKVVKLAPYAYKLDTMLHKVDTVFAEFSGVRDSKKLDELWECIRHEDRLETLLHYAEDVDTSFHHAVIRNEPDDLFFEMYAWQQIDPYGLVDQVVQPTLLQNRLRKESKERFLDDGNCNEILFLDGDMQEHLSRRYGRLVYIATRSRQRARRILEDYKAPDLMHQLKQEMKNAYTAITFAAFLGNEPIKVMSDEQIFDQERDIFPDDRFDNEFEFVWLEALVKALGQNAKGSKAYAKVLIDEFGERNKDRVQYKQVLRQDTAPKFASALHEVIRNDTQTRLAFERIIESLPFAFAVHSAEKNMRHAVFGNDTDKSLEVADPAFMIGSMYLNHYARWREDGIINVAKELARINPSQLIWQSAVSQEKGVVTDDRIAALGSVVKSLKIGQQHPLVRMTRSVKENENGKKEIGREGSQGDR